MMPLEVVRVFEVDVIRGDEEGKDMGDEVALVIGEGGLLVEVLREVHRLE